MFYENGVRGEALQRMNQCRLFLHVSMVSDITTGDGRFIKHSVRQGEVDVWTYKHNEYPNQGRPTESTWAMWNLKLSEILCSGGKDMKLNNALGRWTDELPKKWEWFYLMYEERVYRKTENGWSYYITTLTRRDRHFKTFIFRGSTTANQVPGSL